MKRFLAIILAMVLVLSMSATVLADGTANGSITITNATKDDNYELFKIFDASYAVDDAGNTIVDENGKAVVSYTIDDKNQFFDDMFGANGTANTYFNYEAKTGVVTKKVGASDADVITYLTNLVRADGADADQSKVGGDEPTLVFDGLTPGYYLIDKGTPAVVTITSNLPNVQVIDKNQRPNVDDDFDKLIFDQATGTWVEQNSANVGDIVNWKINFTATNYDGDDQVLYYAIRDVKSSSLWVEFDDIEVKIGNETLTRGYYHCAVEGSIVDTDEWEYLGNWDGVEKDCDNAQWYLIHYGYDEFEIVVPWLSNHTFKGLQSTTKGYTLTFDLDEEDNNNILSTSLYGSPVDVEVLYSAAVTPDALLGGTIGNSAVLDWVTPEGTFGPNDPETTETKVYNMGITKSANDGTSSTPASRLAGAVFEVYRDQACTQPVYVIPTNNKGVYVVDDLTTDVSGKLRQSARDKYKGYWEAYISENGTNQRNDVVTPDHGQVIVLGLAAGTYYLKETVAPAGYNQLAEPVEVTVGPPGTNTGVYDNNYKKLADGSDVTINVYHIDVVNSKGVELPSTGGTGTMMLLTFGSVIAVAFAVFLITHKKMSIYKD